MRIGTFATSVWLTLLGTMALAQSVTYDYDRAASFSNYKTYAWTRGTEVTDELIHIRIVRAIDRALVAKGLARVENSTANPDVLVAYHASFEKNLEITGRPTGGGPLVSAEAGWRRRGFSRLWSERLSSTSPTPGRARSCGGAWPAATSGQRTSPRVATRRSRTRRRRCSRITRRSQDDPDADRALSVPASRAYTSAAEMS